MEVQSLFQKLPGFIDSIEWYHILGIFFGVGVFFGQRKEWEYEAKLFPPDSNKYGGELELKKYKKENPVGELQAKPALDFNASNIQVVVDGIELGKMSLDSSGQYIQPGGQKKHMKYRDRNQIKWNKYYFEFGDFQPGNNQKVEVFKDRELVLTGILLQD